MGDVVAAAVEALHLEAERGTGVRYHGKDRRYGGERRDGRHG